MHTNNKSGRIRQDLLFAVWTALRPGDSLVDNLADLTTSGVVAGAERAVGIAGYYPVVECRLYVAEERRVGWYVGEVPRCRTIIRPTLCQHHYLRQLTASYIVTRSERPV